MRLNEIRLFSAGMSLKLFNPTFPDFFEKNIKNKLFLTLLGRWLSRDPIQEGGVFNLYVMVSNNAVGRWDYLGKSFWGRLGNALTGAASGAIAGAIAVNGTILGYDFDTYTAEGWLGETNECECEK